MKLKYILFDLDGTLVDSYKGVSHCFRYSLGCLGTEVPEDEDLGWIIGPPLRFSYERYGYKGEDVEFLLAKYRELYNVEGVHENTMYDGVPEMLQSLSDLGLKMALASCKPTKACETVLSDFGIEKYFCEVVGASLDRSRSSKAAVIHDVLTRLDIESKSEVLMIGDRFYDIDGAHENKIPAMGAAWGYGSVPELMGCDADFIAGAPSDAAGIIADYQKTIGNI